MAEPKTIPEEYKPYTPPMPVQQVPPTRPDGTLQNTLRGVANEAGYVELNRILTQAYNQAASGKRAERHSISPVGFMPWHQQPILANARQVGAGAPAGQVMKKAQESVTMAGNGNFTGAKAEALGAIVYAAALYKLYEEMEEAATGVQRTR